MKFIFLVLSVIFCLPCHAQLTLNADKAPAFKGWAAPAMLSYTRNGDGTSNSTIDAYLQYTIENNNKSDTPLRSMKDDWIIAGYIHKDDGGEARKNDRGLSFGYSRFIVPDYDLGGSPMYYSWTAKISLGKSLQKNADESAEISFFDKTKDRQQLFLSAYIQPSSAIRDQDPHRRGKALSQDPRLLDMYFIVTAGVYSDNNSGGDSGGGGRVSGTMASAEWNLFPLGLVAADNQVGGYGVVPVLTLSAQGQHDSSARGARIKQTYKLYTAMLTLEFDAIVASNSIGRLRPSLNFSRSVGADLLGGRPYEGKTEIAFGLTF